MKKYWIFGEKAKYESLSWWENFMNSHISIGPITIYGANAMCWAVNIRNNKYGYICFTLPSIRRKRYELKHYFYVSPDGTSGASTFYRGKADYGEQQRADLRRKYLGHRFNYMDLKVYEIYNYIRNYNDIPPDMKANEIRAKKLNSL